MLGIATASMSSTAIETKGGRLSLSVVMSPSSSSSPAASAPSTVVTDVASTPSSGGTISHSGIWWLVREILIGVRSAFVLCVTETEGIYFLLLGNVVDIGCNFFNRHAIPELINQEIPMDPQPLGPALIGHFRINVIGDEGTC